MIAAIKFITSPVGKWIGIALVVLAFIAWQRNDAAHEATMEAREQCRVEVEERTNEEIERQRTIAEQILADAMERQTISEEENQRLREMADELTQQLRESGATCPLDPDTLRRLRDIR